MNGYETQGFNLHSYARAKFDLWEILQSVVAAGVVDNDRRLHDGLQSALVRLAEDRFNLIVAGRFSRGKSSLMNAVLGMDRLPTGILPLTSVVTTVSYGTQEKVTLKFRERRLDLQIGIDQLPEYITQRGNPGNRQGIAVAHIELPAEILRLGFSFVDTPGLGSAIPENTLTTNAYLPEGDALLLVTSFESPLSEDEFAFIHLASRTELPVFLAVNKQDLVTSDERAEVLDFVRSRVEEIDTVSAANVFAISARDGLSAKLAHDAFRLEASGLPALEGELTRFLLEQKRTVFLARMCGRISELLAEVPFFKERDVLSDRLHGLAKRYRTTTLADYRPAISRNEEPVFHQSQLRPCEICAAVESSVWDFLTRYQYELSRSRDCQADFAQRGGFCSYHTSEYKGIASPYGICSGYPLLLERIARLFRSAAQAGGPPPRDVIEMALARRDTCPLCDARNDAERVAISELVNRLRKSTATCLANLSALCLPHLQAIAGLLAEPEILRLLLGQHALILGRAAQDMRGFTLKQSAARRYLQSDEEEMAARRALLILAGVPSANFAFGQAAQTPNPDLRKTSA